MCRKRTLANLSDWPQGKIDALRAVLQGAPAGTNPGDAFEISRSRLHGPRQSRAKRTHDGQPVHSFRTLLADLGSIVRNTCTHTTIDAPSFQKTTRPTSLQQRALDLLGVKLAL